MKAATTSRLPYSGRGSVSGALHLDLTDEQAELLLATLDRFIENDRYPLSHRIRALRQTALMKPYRGPPATLGSTTAANVRLIVWCRDCRHQIEPDPAEMAERYGAELAVIDWVKRLTCSQCGSRSVDFVFSMAEKGQQYMLGDARRDGSIAPIPDIPAPCRRSSAVIHPQAYGPTPT